MLKISFLLRNLKWILLIVIIVIMGLFGFFFMIVSMIGGAIYSVFSFGAADDPIPIKNYYISVASESGVTWTDVAIYDAIRTENDYKGVEEETIRTSTEEFYYTEEVCEMVTEEVKIPLLDENGNELINDEGMVMYQELLDDDGNVIHDEYGNVLYEKTEEETEVCEDEYFYYSLEEVLQRFDYDEETIDYALELRENNDLFDEND